MQTVTEGSLAVTSCKLVSPEAEEEAGPGEGMPTFLTSGTVRVDGVAEPFTCKISIEFDGRDVEYEHVSGYDVNDPNGVLQDLLLAVSKTPAYQKAAADYGF